jgi:hypothetical protein
MRFFKKIFLVFSGIFFTFRAALVLAVRGGFGGIATNVFSAEMNLHQLLRVVCIASGVGMILSAFIKYRRYRKNPLEVQMGTVITNLVIGALLIILAFIPIGI